MMKKILKIKLKSDLCVASGYSYKGIVDSDVCYDDLGLPYIPARRLKGCFRDTLENILYSTDVLGTVDINLLFGARGSNIGGCIRISNAKLENYDDIRAKIKSLKNKIDLKGVFSKQRVLEQYTHIVAQTEIGKGNAAENTTLRYTKAINHYIPNIKDEFVETVFEATIEFDEKIITEDDLKLIVGATKHIGLKRNRGMGHVQCSIEDLSNKNAEIDENNTKNSGDVNSEQEYVITYVLENDEPLMLSQMSDTHSEKYISGQTILGQLAGLFLKKSENSAESEEFKDLFLNGNTKYVPAYPAAMKEQDNLCIYYPAPLNINRLKKSRDYVNTFFEIPEEKACPGNQPKKIKDKFVCLENTPNGTTTIDIKEVSMKLYYHHRKDKVGSNGVNEAGILYPSEAIEPYQLFSGQIYTKGKYVETIIDLIDNADFYFGKSKGAQYGHCACKVVKSPERLDHKELNANGKNNRIIITMLTDAIFMTNDDYTVDSDEIINQLVSIIPNSSGISKEQQCVMMETGLISGYQTTWNLHKPLYPVVKAGSCFVIDCSDCTNIPQNIWVGTKNQEGFGYAKVEFLNNDEICESNHNTENKQLNDNTASFFEMQYINIIKEMLIESLISETKEITFNKASKTQISRALLMLKQCKDFEDFKNRINSIKTDSVRIEFTQKLINPLDIEGKANISKLVQKSENAKVYYNVLNDRQKEEINSVWKDYLLYRLTICKFEAKEV